jgi:hypothetical protein
MELSFGAGLDLPRSNAIDLNVTPLVPARLIRLSFNLTINSVGRDQEVRLNYNSDMTAGNYRSLVEASAPFLHNAIGFAANSGLIIAYCGWGQDADVCIDLLASLEPGRKRNVTGTAAVAHGNSNQYSIKTGGAYLSAAGPISSIRISLPYGRFFSGYVVPTRLA